MKGYWSGMGSLTHERASRDPGDRRWPTRYVGILIAGYTVLVWIGLLTLFGSALP